MVVAKYDGQLRDRGAQDRAHGDQVECQRDRRVGGSVGITSAVDEDA